VSCEYAVHVMVVVPAEKGASELLRVQFVPLASQVYIGCPSLRVAVIVRLSPVPVAVPTVTIAEQLLSASAVLLAGQLIVGGLLPLSWTVTVKLQLPPLSADVEVTVVVPTGKNEPDAGVVVMAPQSPVEVVSSNVT